MCVPHHTYYNDVKQQSRENFALNIFMYILHQTKCGAGLNWMSWCLSTSVRPLRTCQTSLQYKLKTQSSRKTCSEVQSGWSWQKTDLRLIIFLLAQYLNITVESEAVEEEGEWRRFSSWSWEVCLSLVADRFFCHKLYLQFFWRV